MVVVATTFATLKDTELKDKLAKRRNMETNQEVNESRMQQFEESLREKGQSKRSLVSSDPELTKKLFDRLQVEQSQTPTGRVQELLNETAAKPAVVSLDLELSEKLTDRLQVEQTQTPTESVQKLLNETAAQPAVASLDLELLEKLTDRLQVEQTQTPSESVQKLLNETAVVKRPVDQGISQQLRDKLAHRLRLTQTQSFSPNINVAESPKEADMANVSPELQSLMQKPRLRFQEKGPTLVSLNFTEENLAIIDMIVGDRQKAKVNMCEFKHTGYDLNALSEAKAENIREEIEEACAKLCQVPRHWVTVNLVPGCIKSVVVVLDPEYQADDDDFQEVCAPIFLKGIVNDPACAAARIPEEEVAFASEQTKVILWDTSRSDDGVLSVSCFGILQMKGVKKDLPVATQFSDQTQCAQSGVNRVVHCRNKDCPKQIFVGSFGYGQISALKANLGVCLKCGENLCLPKYEWLYMVDCFFKVVEPNHKKVSSNWLDSGDFPAATIFPKKEEVVAQLKLMRSAESAEVLRFRRAEGKESLQAFLKDEEACWHRFSDPVVYACKRDLNLTDDEMDALVGLTSDKGCRRNSGSTRISSASSKGSSSGSPGRSSSAPSEGTGSEGSGSPGSPPPQAARPAQDPTMVPQDSPLNPSANPQAQSFPQPNFMKTLLLHQQQRGACLTLRVSAGHDQIHALEFVNTLSDGQEKTIQVGEPHAEWSESFDAKGMLDMLVSTVDGSVVGLCVIMMGDEKLKVFGKSFLPGAPLRHNLVSGPLEVTAAWSSRGLCSLETKVVRSDDNAAYTAEVNKIKLAKLASLDADRMCVCNPESGRMDHECEQMSLTDMIQKKGSGSGRIQLPTVMGAGGASGSGSQQSNISDQSYIRCCKHCDFWQFMDTPPEGTRFTCR